MLSIYPYKMYEFHETMCFRCWNLLKCSKIRQSLFKFTKIKQEQVSEKFALWCQSEQKWGKTFRKILKTFHVNILKKKKKMITKRKNFIYCILRYFLDVFSKFSLFNIYLHLIETFQHVSTHTAHAYTLQWNSF